MADNLQERTEQPTHRRREKARDDGQVARSPEIATAVLLFAAAGLITVGTPRLAAGIVELFATTTLLTPGPATPDAAASWLRDVAARTAVGLAPLLLGVTAMVAATGAIQARGILTFQPLAPKWERLAPHSNLKRMLGFQPVVELVKSLAKLVLVATVVWLALRSAIPDLLALGIQAPAALPPVVLRLVTRVLVSAGIAYLALAAADYFWQLWRHEKEMRMTREEVRQEQKDTEGDAMVKARRRALGRAFARRQMFSAVPLADVVITNPTHIAVALRYDPEKFAAPTVLAMGERKIAERIKAVAAEAGVPLVENKPLARALLATAEIGLPIPPALYVAVAEVLAFVLRQRSSTGRAWRLS